MSDAIAVAGIRVHVSKYGIELRYKIPKAIVGIVFAT